MFFSLFVQFQIISFLLVKLLISVDNDAFCFV